jgi:hypothetical protein
LKKELEFFQLLLLKNTFLWFQKENIFFTKFASVTSYENDQNPHR